MKTTLKGAALLSLSALPLLAAPMASAASPAAVSIPSASAVTPAGDSLVGSTPTSVSTPIKNGTKVVTTTSVQDGSLSTTTKTYRVTLTTNTNLRTGPGVGYRVAATLKPGTVLTAITTTYDHVSGSGAVLKESSSGSWAKVTSGPHAGTWINTAVAKTTVTSTQANFQALFKKVTSTTTNISMVDSGPVIVKGDYVHLSAPATTKAGCASTVAADKAQIAKLSGTVTSASACTLTQSGWQADVFYTSTTPLADDQLASEPWAGELVQMNFAHTLPANTTQAGATKAMDTALAQLKAKPDAAVVDSVLVTPNTDGTYTASIAYHAAAPFFAGDSGWAVA